jgi:hypothetical protein
MGVLKKAVRLIGPALLIFIFIKFVDIPLLLKTFRNASLYYLFSSYLLTMALFMGKLLRIYLPLTRSSVSIKFYYFTKIFMSTRLLGWLTNTFLSDVANAGILMATHEKKMRISNIFILNRVADVTATLILFGITFYLNVYLINPYLHVSYQKIIAIFCIVSAVLLLIFFLKAQVMAYVKDFLSAGKTFLSSAINLTVGIAICTIFSVISNAKALHLDISPSFLLLCYSVGITISVLPISISGIGTREITFIFLMKLVNVPSEKAIAFSFIEFIFMPLLSLATLYVVALIGEYRENSRHS